MFHDKHKALSLEGLLRCTAFNPLKASSLFRFKKIENYTVEKSAILINKKSNKVLDVPNASRKKG